MKMMNGLWLIGLGVGGTLLYQSYQKGELQKTMKKVCKTKEKIIDDMSDMAKSVSK